MDICLQGDGISRDHARITVNDSGVHLVDLKSMNGSFVNSVRVVQALLRDGDKIQFGTSVILKFAYQDEIDEDFQRQMFAAATFDAETNLYSRRLFLECLANELAHAKRHERALASVCFVVRDYDRTIGVLDQSTRSYVFRMIGMLVNSSIQGEPIAARLEENRFMVLMRGDSVVSARESAVALMGRSGRMAQAAAFLTRCVAEVSSMRAWSRSFLIAAVMLDSISACSATHGAGNVQSRGPDASNTRPGIADSGNTTLPAPVIDVGMGFVRIPLETGSDCAEPRQSIALGTAPNVLVTTGCALYTVNSVTHEVVLRMPGSRVIAGDGSTVAVIAEQLGLSLDSGETFTWTDWALGRCGGRPGLNVGAGVAVVDCIAGAGRWRGEGTVFEPLMLGSSGSILPIVAARDAHVIVNASDGWHESIDHGDSFQPWRVSGLADNVRPDGIEIVDAKLFALAQIGAGTDGSHMEFFAAPLAGGVFVRVAALPPIKGTPVWNYNEGTLVVMSGNTLYFSTDTGESFTEVKLEGLVIPLMLSVAAIQYGSGHVYILTREALYVGPLPTHG